MMIKKINAFIHPVKKEFLMACCIFVSIFVIHLLIDKDDD